MPWSVAQVIDKQDGALQRVRSKKVRQWIGYLPSFTVKAFQKKESYQKFTDPRNISTVHTSHILEASCYTYPFKKYVLQRFCRFMPGSKPADIEDRMMCVCGPVDVVLETDYTRLDGTISRWLSENVQDACYLRYFGDDPQLIDILNRQRLGRGVTQYGVKYEPECSRLSGSPFTTDGNTLICGFVAYVTYREAGFSAAQSINMPALLYGDDGVIGGLEASTMERVAKDFGLKLKCQVRHHGEPVGFVGRIFQDPWTTASSYQDPVRTMSKIHTTTSNPQVVPDRLALSWKAIAYLVTDSKTPLIRAYCEMVLKNLNIDPTGEMWAMAHMARALLNDLPYFLRHLDGSGWYQDDNDDLRREQMAVMLGIDVGDIALLEDRIRNWTDLSREFDFKSLLQHKVPPVQIPVSVGHNILEPEQDPLDTLKQIRDQIVEKQVRTIAQELAAVVEPEVAKFTPPNRPSTPPVKLAPEQPKIVELSRAQRKAAEMAARVLCRKILNTIRNDVHGLSLGTRKKANKQSTNPSHGRPTLTQCRALRRWSPLRLATRLWQGNPNSNRLDSGERYRLS